MDAPAPVLMHRATSHNGSEEGRGWASRSAVELDQRGTPPQVCLKLFACTRLSPALRMYGVTSSSAAEQAPRVEHARACTRASTHAQDYLTGKGNSNSRGAKPDHQSHLGDEVDSDQEVVNPERTLSTGLGLPPAPLRAPRVELASACTTTGP